MGALLDTITADATGRKGPPCTVQRLLDDPEIGEDLLTALSMHPQVSFQAIARGLRAAGHQVQGSTLSRHHRGECLCE